MPANWFQQLFKVRTSTFNVLVTMIVFAYCYHCAFTVTYVLTHAAKLDKDLMRVVFDIGLQHKDILIFALGYFVKNSKTEKSDATDS